MFVNIFKRLLLWNTWANFNQISFAASWQNEDLRFVQMVMVTWSTWPPCPYMVKTLKHLLLQNHWADWLETWYVVSVDWVLLRFFKWWPYVDLDSFLGPQNEKCGCPIVITSSVRPSVHLSFHTFFVLW